MDVQNPKGETLGERAFLKSLLGSVNSGENPEERVEKLKADIESYRLESELIDDVTLFLLHYGPIELQQKVAA